MGSVLPASIKIPCPNCGNKFEQSLAGLKAKNNRAVCPTCGTGFDGTKLVDSLEAFDKTVADGLRSINKKFGKK